MGTAQNRALTQVKHQDRTLDTLVASGADKIKGFQREFKGSLWTHRFTYFCPDVSINSQQIVESTELRDRESVVSCQSFSFLGVTEQQSHEKTLQVTLF